MPGADESGELADFGIAADILREAGGEPEAVASDRAGSDDRKSRTPARESNESEESDETDDDLDTETDPLAADEAADDDQDQEGENILAADTAEEGAETEGDEPAAAATDADPTKDETPAWAIKRFGEMTAQIHRLRQENEQLRQSPSGSNAAVRPVLTDMEILAAETPEQLARLRESFESVEEFAELNPDGVESDPDRPDVKPFSREQVAQARINARRKLREIATREKQLEQQQHFNAYANTVYPAFKEADSVESQALQNVLRQVPELRRLPNYRTVIGDAIAGQRLREKAAQVSSSQKKSPSGAPLAGKPAVTAVRKAPPVVNGAPTRGNAAPSGKVATRAKYRDRAMRSGSEADIAALVEASLG
jgi:hypothetical protein